VEAGALTAGRLARVPLGAQTTPMNGRDVAGAGMLLLAINLFCAGIGAGIGAAVGALVPLLIVGFFIGFFAGIAFVIKHFGQG
jgi:nitrate/nitrite transporter NarK